MKKLILHIGTEKTGTTTIQHFCHQNRELLEEQGFYYPKIGFCDFAHFSLVAPFHPIDNGGRRLEFAPEGTYRVEEEWNPIKELFHSHENITVLISAEHFSSRLKSAGIERLKETINWLGDDVDVEILMFVRRQDEFFSSWYSTHIKAGGRFTLNEAFDINFYQNWFYDYFYIAEQWAKIFGKDSIKIRVFENAQMPNGLMDEFSRAVGFVITDRFCTEIEDHNIAWPAKLISLARMINEIHLNTPIPNRYDKLNKLVDYFEDDGLSLISEMQTDALLSRYAESNRNLAKHYLDRQNEILFYDKPVFKDHWVEPQEVTQEEVLSLLMNLID